MTDFRILILIDSSELLDHSDDSIARSFESSRNRRNMEYILGQESFLNDNEMAN